MPDHNSTTLQSYAALNFPISDHSLRLGAAFLDRSFPESPDPGEGFSALLCRIIAEKLEERNPDSVLVPLTAGLDSRGVLGATLKVFPRSRIACVTFGTAENFEVVAARQICARHKIPHFQIDPDQHVWTESACLHAIRQGFVRLSAFGTLDMSLFEQMARFCGPDSLLLSGFLGDVVSGSNLRIAEIDESGAALAEFIRRNAGIKPLVPDAPTLDRLRAFLADQQGAVVGRGYRNFSKLDTLDLGLRQALWIRSINSLGEAEVFSPYQDARWLAYWYNQPPEARRGQKLYKQQLRASFPSVFSLPDDKSVPAQLPLPARVWRRITTSLSRSRATPVSHDIESERGNPDRVTSKKELIADLVAAFARRGSLTELDFPKILSDFQASPHAATYKTANLIASMEANLRVGNLADANSF